MVLRPIPLFLKIADQGFSNIFSTEILFGTLNVMKKKQGNKIYD